VLDVPFDVPDVVFSLDDIKAPPGDEYVFVCEFELVDEFVLVSAFEFEDESESDSPFVMEIGWS